MPTAETAAHSSSDIKQAARRAARERRRAFHETRPADIARRFVAQFDRHVVPPADAVISGYWPAGSEPDIRPLLEALHGRGHRIVLPVVVAREQPLVFRRWQPGDLLERGNGAEVPRADRPELDPDLLLVPLLAFDRAGNRLGQGAGYYDRTLARLRSLKQITAIGVGYAAQEAPAVPTTPNDQPLDAVLTEAGLIAIGK